MVSALTESHSRPTVEADRIEILDALRGFALGGIYLLNLAVFTGFVYMVDTAPTGPTAALDMPVAGLIMWLGYGKFYSLFSLLFGIGFSLQLAAAERRGDRQLRTFRRRLWALLLIGAVHMYFWEGDILFLYAAVGFLLIPLRRLPDRALLRATVALLAAPVALKAIVAASGGALDPGEPLLRAGDRVLAAMGFQAGTTPYPLLRDAGWSEYFRFQLSGPFFRYADLLSSGRPFKVLAMFLLGVWVGRSGMLRDLPAWAPVLRRVRRIGFALGLPAALLQIVLMVTQTRDSRWLPIFEAAAYAAGVAPLALAYASTFTLLWLSDAWRVRLGRLAPAGRMALTNYLMQTAISLTAFLGVGFGLMGRIGPAWWPLLVVAMMVVQGVASAWWLARFEFGPMEWVWRQATYGRRLPIRRGPTGTMSV